MHCPPSLDRSSTKSPATRTGTERRAQFPGVCLPMCMPAAVATYARLGANGRIVSFNRACRPVRDVPQSGREACFGFRRRGHDSVRSDGKTHGRQRVHTQRATAPWHAQKRHVGSQWHAPVDCPRRAARAKPWTASRTRRVALDRNRVSLYPNAQRECRRPIRVAATLRAPNDSL